MQPRASERDIERLLDEYAEVLEQNANGCIQDEDIDLSDHPEWTEDMFRDAERGTFFGTRRDPTLIQPDADVITWFRRHYPRDTPAAMNAALRAYMDAHTDGGSGEDAEPDLRKTA